MASDAHIVQYDSSDKIEESQQRNLARLTAEEIRVLKDCNWESFYYRCVPLALTAMAATYLGVKKGILKGHPKYGSSIKQLGAGVIGWMVGKFSYRSVCEEKFLHLQNSPIGDAIRKKRGFAISEFERERLAKSTDDLSFTTEDITSYATDQNFSSTYLDMGRSAPGLDDRERPTTDSFTDLTPEEPPQEFSPVTYDELRQRNRNSYDQQFRSQQTSMPTAPPSSSSQMFDGVARRREFQNEGIARRRDFENEGVARRREFENEGVARRREFENDGVSRRRDFENDGSPRSTYGDWNK